MQSRRFLKQKIQAIDSISQIVKAMEMVALAKIQKIQQKVFEGRFYTLSLVQILRLILSQIPEKKKKTFPLLSAPDKGKVLYLIIGSDKGLCGAFNKNFSNFVFQILQSDKEDKILIVLGKKIKSFLEKNDFSIFQSFERTSDIVSFYEAQNILDFSLKTFLEEKCKTLKIISTSYITAMVSQNKVFSVLPLTFQTLDSLLKEFNFQEEDNIEKIEKNIEKADIFIFEPKDDLLLNEVLEELVKSLIFHILLESNLSEHTARMLAMKKAKDNAKELLDTFQLEYNKARQWAITQEVVEITTGKEAQGE